MKNFPKRAFVRILEVRYFLVLDILNCNSRNSRITLDLLYLFDVCNNVGKLVVAIEMRLKSLYKFLLHSIVTYDIINLFR